MNKRQVLLATAIATLSLQGIATATEVGNISDVNAIHASAIPVQGTHSCAGNGMPGMNACAAGGMPSGMNACAAGGMPTGMNNCAN